MEDEVDELQTWRRWGRRSHWIGNFEKVWTVELRICKKCFWRIFSL
jgi:hypothetical protein